MRGKSKRSERLFKFIPTTGLSFSKKIDEDSNGSTNDLAGANGEGRISPSSLSNNSKIDPPLDIITWDHKMIELLLG